LAELLDALTLKEQGQEEVLGMELERLDVAEEVQEFRPLLEWVLKSEG